MSASVQHAITTRDLNLWYAKFQALKGVTTDIKHGLITSLIGPSGCGKTTLLRCFNRVNERYGYVTTTGVLAEEGPSSGEPSTLEVRHAVIERSHSIGIESLGSTSLIEGTLVRDGQPDTAGGARNDDAFPGKQFFVKTVDYLLHGHDSKRMSYQQT